MGGVNNPPASVVSAFAAPAFTIGESNVEGAATTAVRSDATLLVLDTTVPTTQAFSDAAAAGLAAIAAHRDHLHGMMAAPAAGSLIEIGSVEASASATITVTGLDTAVYEQFVIEIAGIVPATDNVNLYLRMGDASGIDSGAADYGWVSVEANDVGTRAAQSDSSDSEIQLSGAGIGSDAGSGYSGTFFINTGSLSQETTVYGVGAHQNSGFIDQIHASGMRLAVLVLTQIQLLMSSGNITSGRLTVYGVAL